MFAITKNMRKFALLISTNNKLNFLTMAYVISEDCIACGTCIGECPVEAISEGDEQYVIDADVCVSCGACCDNCPTEAIVEE